MINGSLRSRLACLGPFLVVLGGSAMAAPLHQPLPVDSLEQNGELQPMVMHHPVGHAVQATAPVGPALGVLHKDADAGLRRTYSGKSIDVLTYHYDTMPTG